ncbi:methylated-DNA-protein-cysteine methyltransferase-like protein [Elusimicrobium posterum]|uniref:MGMT family protein n=1 Tax=Elusimicrobium posterum TaxID=3116653 RepID=UPI003C766976
MKKEKEPQNFNQRVYDIVRRIPEGWVLSYGQVAELAGNSKASRAVGYAMAGCKDSAVPCHRVLFKDGTLSKAFITKGKNLQYTLLKKENISFTKEKKVNMKKHRWTTDALDYAAFLKYG